MSDSEPIAFHRPGPSIPGRSVAVSSGPSSNNTGGNGREPHVVVFNRLELADIFNVYGRRVASGEWRDYAIDWGRESAVFSIFRRTSEVPLYRVVKAPKLARKQGAYSIVSANGQILKRGHDLKRVLDAIDQRLVLVK
ncbi:MAG: DUF2794 domain-containing protein [Hyphomicrobiaceae bacterium]|nr:DUF2794 domain-containing protein [Hyphomicrobiaceae bacterium]